MTVKSFIGLASWCFYSYAECHHAECHYAECLGAKRDKRFCEKKRESREKFFFLSFCLGFAVF
jgi:hypothetical protein